MSLAVPKIGLEAPVVELGKGDAGELDAPRRFDRVGWWSDGIVPGEAGPAVIAGHVDFADGPAVFHRLHEPLPGDEVLVRHEDATSEREPEDTASPWFWLRVMSPARHIP